MSTTLLTVTTSDTRLTVVAIRRHVALVRTLLEEIERLVPSTGARAHREDISKQLVEELTLLSHRLLECTATMSQTLGLGASPVPVHGADVDPASGMPIERAIDRQGGANEVVDRRPRPRCPSDPALLRGLGHGSENGK